MSGPKVVNLEAVRRRRQRECLAHLHALRETVAEWRSAMKRAGFLTDQLTREASMMLERLDELRQSERWSPLQAELSAQLAFFREGTANARETAIQRKATSRERSRRLEVAAAMLQREWRAAGGLPPPELNEVIRASNTEDETELAWMSLFSRPSRSCRVHPRPV